ncbi:hypothetical protein COCSUDRAFT_58089 [Coccomyxa subellipsoidea C-169]|uniref:Uncharacterized protein n=1 Tax=Coccomyxa subellipsoidea (strain C-169) TaxID=574566 RepID=I0YN83_COCSC|nr:hypothetical protein COCSUDRAFT_58089 [Coccomyxa subellipsoidea C-169]EIE19852.1 hypothetical protein COCSUDRAFT_58089 [Coccomyxa subellipsoidea C-169]|eukprot:XP_005644396.1 hypothetical protein COCSUDRAFT_58089 [Coccomyxa subellipsoidea C-169]
MTNHVWNNETEDSRSRAEEAAEGQSQPQHAGSPVRDSASVEARQDSASLQTEGPEHTAAAAHAASDVSMPPSSVALARNVDSHSLPSVFTFGGSHVPFADTLGSANIEAGPSLDEARAERLAASEQGASPVHRGKTSWEQEDQGSFTAADVSSAYSGMYAELAARAAVLAAELPNFDHGLHRGHDSAAADSACFGGDAYCGGGTGFDGDAYFGGGGSGAIFGDGANPGDGAASAYFSNAACCGGGTYWDTEQPPPPLPGSVSARESHFFCGNSILDKVLGHGDGMPIRADSPGVFPGGRSVQDERLQTGASAEVPALEHSRGNVGPGQDGLHGERELPRVPWHELLLHAPLYPERDATERLPGAGRSPRRAGSSNRNLSGQNRRAAGAGGTARQWVDVGARAHPLSCQPGPQLAADLASSRVYSLQPAPPARERPRCSRRAAHNNADAHVSIPSFPASARVLSTQRGNEKGAAEKWPDQNRPQSAPQRTPRSAAGIPRSVVTSVKGPRRMDRVARWQQMQQTWARDPFLKNGAAGGNKEGKRKKIGYREAFGEVHAANDEMRSLYVQLATSSVA